MNILVLNYEYPPLGGGAAPVSAELAMRFAARGHRVNVVTMSFPGLPPYEERDGVRIWRVPCFRRRKELCSPFEQATYVLSAVRFLRKHIRKHSYDAVHAHFLIPTGIVAWWLNRRYGIPYLVTMHGSDIPGYNPDRFIFLHRFTRPLLRAIAGRAQRVISPSRYLRSLFSQRVGDDTTDRVEHIPNGIDPNSFTPLSKERIILATGRLLPRKGFQHLIRAVSDVDIGYEVHIAGDGPMMPELRRLAELSATPVVFHGWMDGASREYRELLGRAAVYCLPSERENASIALLEAMSARCAIVTSNAPGCAETVGDAGLTVPFGNVDALKDALTRVTAPGAAGSLGERARARIEEKFTWDDISGRYEEMLSAIDIGMRRSISDRPLISIVILSMNKTKEILACIESIRKQSYRNVNIIVVDNGSTDGTPEAIERLHPDVHLLRNTVNRGICTGRNQGFRYALERFSATYILQLDNDTVLEPEYLENLFSALQEDQSAGMAFGKGYTRYPSTTLASAGIAVNFWTGVIKDLGSGQSDRGQYNERAYVDAAPGFGNLIRMKALLATGGWNTDYNPYGWDDTEFCLRLRRLGYRIVYVPEAKIYHSGTQLNRTPIPAYERAKTRNYFKIVRDFASFPQKVTIYLLLPFRLVLLVGRHIRHGRGFVFKSYMKGLYDWIRESRIV